MGIVTNDLIVQLSSFDHQYTHNFFHRRLPL
jgi:hypothetical protein